MIDLSAFSGVSFDDLTITSSGVGTKVDVNDGFGGKARFFLWNVNADDLDESGFIFHQDAGADGM